MNASNPRRSYRRSASTASPNSNFIVNNPTCFPGVDVPLTNFSTCGPATSGASNIYQISSSLHAPYTLQGAIGVERQVTKSATVSATYLNSRGFDQFVTVNANAPFPGTPCSQLGAVSTLPNCATGKPAETSTATSPRVISNRTS